MPAANSPPFAFPLPSLRLALRCAALCLAPIVALLLASAAAAQDKGLVTIEFDPADFNDSRTIDNTYFPLIPETIFTYRGEGEDGCEWNVFKVTDDDTKVVAGVPVVVVIDQAYEDEACDGFSGDELIERTHDWFAQDDHGNVWYLGEFSEDCEGDTDCAVNDGSWEAGIDGAKPGIQMLAMPASGNRYYQEYYEDHAEDQAKVDRTDAWVSLYDSTVFDRDLHHCIRTKEWTALEPGAIEHKFYCPQVGLVLVEELKGRTLRVELVDLIPSP